MLARHEKCRRQPNQLARVGRYRCESCVMPTKTKSKTSKRTLIEPHKGDKRYVRRNKQGEFKKEVDVGRSLAADRRSKAKTTVAKGQGDRGDVKR
jgi:hypothetical protein